MTDSNPKPEVDIEQLTQQFFDWIVFPLPEPELALEKFLSVFWNKVIDTVDDFCSGTHSIDHNVFCNEMTALRLELFSLAGTTVPAFSPEDLLLVLSVHGASHGWRNLKLVCDVAELMRRHPQIDLPGVFARAGGHGVRRMVSLGLLLASELLDATLPAAVLHALRMDPMTRSLAAQVCAWVFSARDEGYLIRRLKEAVFSIRLRERWRDRIPYALYFLTYPLRARASIAEARAEPTRFSDLSL